MEIFMRKSLIVVIIVLSISIGAVYALFLRDIADARIRVSDQSQTIATPFGEIEYALRGQGEPVLAIHGAAGGFDQGLDMVGALSRDGYRLIAPSRFGYLRSALPADPTNAMQADAYAALLDRLGIQDVAIVAISAGAWSALQFAIRHPDRCRALVLLVPADYLPAGTSIHGGSVVRAIFNSDVIAWAASKLMALLPGEMSRMMLGTDPALLRTA
jgi:pimeloyl-ACP methyl ester carboxylesterase